MDAQTQPRTHATPLAASMSLTFVASIGTFVVESGIFFLTSHTYRFPSAENYALGVGLGLTYIVGAMGAGPLLRRLRRASPRLNSRFVLAAMMILMAALCAIPWTVRRWFESPDASPSHWPIWVLVLTYSPLTGILWPMVESYIAGGRSGKSLRSTMGWWNVVWSGALVIASVGISPFVKDRAHEVMLWLGGLHVACIPLVLAFGAEPLPHPHEAGHACPPTYAPLLVTFRWLLPMSYVISSAMMPFLPGLMEKLSIGPATQTLIAATWLLARTTFFYIMEHTHAWHGRWWHPAVALLLLLAGFAVVALCHVLQGQISGIQLLVVGLALFGIGMALTYAGAIYYAMEVGKAEVEAGGTHEGLIGVGYSVGPGIGLLATLAVTGKVLTSDLLEPGILAVVASICLVVAAIVIWRITVQAGRTPPLPPT